MIKVGVFAFGADRAVEEELVEVELVAAFADAEAEAKPEDKDTDPEARDAVIVALREPDVEFPAEVELRALEVEFPEVELPEVDDFGTAVKFFPF